MMAVPGFSNARRRNFIVEVVQVVHDHVHRHRRAEEREDDQGEEANGRATHASQSAQSLEVARYIPAMTNPSAPEDEATPRWVRIFAIVAGLLILLFVIIHVTGGGFGNATVSMGNGRTVARHPCSAHVGQDALTCLRRASRARKTLIGVLRPMPRISVRMAGIVVFERHRPDRSFQCTDA